MSYTYAPYPSFHPAFLPPEAFQKSVIYYYSKLLYNNTAFFSKKYPTLAFPYSICKPIQRGAGSCFRGVLCGDKTLVLLFGFVSFRFGFEEGIWYHIPPSLYNFIFRGVGINASWVVTRFAEMPVGTIGQSAFCWKWMVLDYVVGWQGAPGSGV